MLFLHVRSDFFASELNLIPSLRVLFDTTVEFALCAKTFPLKRVIGIAAVTVINSISELIIVKFAIR